MCFSPARPSLNVTRISCSFDLPRYAIFGHSLKRSPARHSKLVTLASDSAPALQAIGSLARRYSSTRRCDSALGSNEADNPASSGRAVSNRTYDSQGTDNERVLPCAAIPLQRIAIRRRAESSLKSTNADSALAETCQCCKQTSCVQPVLRCGGGPIVRKPLLNFRDRSQAGGFSGLHQFTATRKAVPFDGSDGCRYNQIGLVAPPWSDVV